MRCDLLIISTVSQSLLKGCDMVGCVVYGEEYLGCQMVVQVSFLKMYLGFRVNWLKVYVYFE